jgi:hypothetical protein
MGLFCIDKTSNLCYARRRSQTKKGGRAMSDDIHSFKFKQWTMVVDKADEKYNICNVGSDGKKQFYEIIVGEYGQPIIVAEPGYAFDAPANLRYVDAKGKMVRPAQQIAGIICKDGPRFSLTNAKKQGVEIKTNDDGSIQVGNQAWWIKTLLVKDKNRIINYDAFCVPRDAWPTPLGVQILELGDLNLF